MDKTEKLRQLHDLKTSGILSDDEFDIEKNKILNEGDSPQVMVSPPPPPPEMMQGGTPLPPPPQQGSSGSNVAAIIAIVVVAIVVIGIILTAVLYVWAASFLEQGESAPIATFFTEETNGGYWVVNVIKVSKEEDLSGFSYFLKDESESVHVGGNGFGEVAMQIIGGEEYGIDATYCSVSLECNAQLQNRAENVSADDGSRYPVHFIDGDRDGRLSTGDTFEVYGYQEGYANGPAEDGWRLDIQFDATGDIIGSAKLL